MRGSSAHAASLPTKQVDVELDDLQIRPLTHRNASGDAYQRTPEVSHQIKKALALTPAQMVERAKIRDYRSPDSLREECLVYLIREHHRLGQDAIVDDLTAALIGRCAKYINEKLQALGYDEVERAFRDVVGSLFELILDLDDDRGDFLQVRFWVVLQRLVIATFHKYKDDLNRAADTISLASLAGYEGDDDDDSGHTAHAEPRRETTIPIDQLVLAREGLNAIEEPYRTAFILAHHERWPIDSKDPLTPSISRYFGKTGRTIQNWLYKAEEALERWRGQQL